MKTLTILINSSPYSMETTKTAMEVAQTANDKGYNVKVYLYVDGTWLPHIKKGIEGPFKDMLENALNSGIEITSCARCAEMREAVDEDILDGIPLVGLFTLTNYIDESNTVLTFR